MLNKFVKKVSNYYHYNDSSYIHFSLDFSLFLSFSLHIGCSFHFSLFLTICLKINKK